MKPLGWRMKANEADTVERPKLGRAREKQRMGEWSDDRTIETLLKSGLYFQARVAELEADAANLRQLLSTYLEARDNALRRVAELEAERSPIAPGGAQCSK